MACHGNRLEAHLAGRAAAEIRPAAPEVAVRIVAEPYSLIQGASTGPLLAR